MRFASPWGIRLLKEWTSLSSRLHMVRTAIVVVITEMKFEHSFAIISHLVLDGGDVGDIEETGHCKILSPLRGREVQ